MSLTGVSAAWRPELAGMLLDGARSGSVSFTEVVVENVDPADPPADLVELARRGVTVVPHGVTLGIAGADQPAAGRLQWLAELAVALDAPLVSEHVAFVRARGVGLDDGAAGGHADVLEAGHLMPAPRTAEALDVLVENVHLAQAALPVPLALENIAALFGWPEDGYDEPSYLRELVERTGVRLVLDLANVYASCTARGVDAAAELRRYPLEAVAYVHIAGGRFDGGLYLDTHADPICPEVLDLLALWRDSQGSLGGVRAGESPLPGVLLERDESVTESAVRREMLVPTRGSRDRLNDREVRDGDCTGSVPDLRGDRRVREHRGPRSRPRATRWTHGRVGRPVGRGRWRIGLVLRRIGRGLAPLRSRRRLQLQREQLRVELVDQFEQLWFLLT